MILRKLVLVVAAVSLGCVASVRNHRIQKPFVEAPAGTKIALVSIEVPPWVANAAPKTDNPATQMKDAVLAAFPSGPYQIVDATEHGYFLPTGPKTEPRVLETANLLTEANQPYAFDADRIVQAVGAPPITWKVSVAPLGFEIDSKTGTIAWTPEKVGDHGIELVAANGLGETKYTFTVKVVEAGKLPGNAPPLRAPLSAGITDAQPFTGALVDPVPAAIDAPLLLGVQVLGWSESTETDGKFTRRKVSTDVVYSLFTRSGKEVETRRVRVAQIPSASFQNAVTFVPDRDAVMKWSQPWDVPLGYAPVTKDELFPAVAKASAVAFAYPYGEQKVMLSMQLDESSEALKPGIALSDKEDYQGALESFAAAAAANPQLAGAFFNMGVMCEMLGRDAEALEHYRQASLLSPKEERFRMARDFVSRRVEKRVSVELP